MAGLMLWWWLIFGLGCAMFGAALGLLAGALMCEAGRQ